MSLLHLRMGGANRYAEEMSGVSALAYQTSQTQMTLNPSEVTHEN